MEALLQLAAPVPDWHCQLRLSEFGSAEWFALAQQMFDFTGYNVFVIGAGGEVPAVRLTNNDLRNVPTELPVSNTDWQGQPRVRRRPNSDSTAAEPTPLLPRSALPHIIPL